MAHRKVLQIIMSAPKRVKVGTRTTKSGNVVGIWMNNPAGSVPFITSINGVQRVKTITHQRAFN